MKKIVVLIALMFMTLAMFAQGGCPERLSYQAVIRDSQNKLVTDRSDITVEFVIEADGREVYWEKHVNVNSNANGLISIMLGEDFESNRGSISGINWPNATITTSVKVGNEEPTSATAPVVAVPYALYACEINPESVTITTLKTDINNHIDDTLGHYFTKTETQTLVHDTAEVLRDLINDLGQSGSADLSALRIKMHNDSITYTARMHEDSLTLAARIQGDSVTLTDKIRLDSTAIMAHIKDTLKNYLLTKDLCDSVVKCPDIIGMKADIAANASNIAINKQAIKDTAAAIRASIHALDSVDSVDLSAVYAKIKADSTLLAKADSTIKARIVTDSTAIMTHIQDTLKKYLLTKDLCDSVMNCEGITEMKTGIATNASNIAANAQGIKDTAAAIRASIHALDSVDSVDLTKVYAKIKADSTLLAKADSTIKARIVTDSTAIMAHIKDTLNKYYLKIETQTLVHDTAEVLRNMINSAIDTLVGKNTIATVATSGSYNDLADKPEIPTPFSGDYNDLTNTPEIPVVNDGKLAVILNKDTIGKFSADQSENVTIKLMNKMTTLKLVLDSEEDSTHFRSLDTAAASAVATVLPIPEGFTNIDTTNHIVQLFINGVYVGDTDDGVVTIYKNRLYYDAEKNDIYYPMIGDRIKVVYWVK